MDHFGIGAAIMGSVRIYLQSARKTGRTQSLIESVKDGDCVVFDNEAEAKRVKKFCKERGVDIGTFVVSPSRPEDILQYGVPQGRLILDHGWVEKFYLLSIERAQGYIDKIQHESSGTGHSREEIFKMNYLNRWET